MLFLIERMTLANAYSKIVKKKVHSFILFQKGPVYFFYQIRNSKSFMFHFFKNLTNAVTYFIDLGSTEEKNVRLSALNSSASWIWYISMSE